MSRWNRRRDNMGIGASAAAPAALPATAPVAVFVAGGGSFRKRDPLDRVLFRFSGLLVRYAREGAWVSG